VILRLRNMTALDATGLFAIEEVARQLHASNRTLILCGAREQPASLMHQAEFEEVVGRENICDNVQAALRRADTGPDMTASPAAQQAFQTACASLPVVELGSDFSTRDAGEACAGLLEKIEARLNPKT
jgi:hypothetical protein